MLSRMLKEGIVDLLTANISHFALNIASMEIETVSN